MEQVPILHNGAKKKFEMFVISWTNTWQNLLKILKKQ